MMSDGAFFGQSIELFNNAVKMVRHHFPMQKMTVKSASRCWRTISTRCVLVNIRCLLPLIACTVLASCANLLGPRQIELPLARLQEGLERRFPVDKRILSLFDIQLSRPQLTILPDTDRVALSVDARMAPPFTNHSWHGSLALSGHLTMDAARSAIYIGEVRIDRFMLDGVDEERQRQLAKAANVIMDKLVREMPLHRFAPDDLRFAGMQFVPTRIATTPTGLIVMVEVAK